MKFRAFSKKKRIFYVCKKKNTFQNAIKLMLGILRPNHKVLVMLFEVEQTLHQKKRFGCWEGVKKDIILK